MSRRREAASVARKAMRRVLLVSSIHHEMGNATVGELTWLLGRLQPDVLFLEHPSSDLSAFLDGSCGTLESAAVRCYRNFHRVELVPVDLHVPATELKQKVDALFNRIEKASPRYCELELANRQHTAMGGFAYLNSPTCTLLQSEIQREMRATVEAVGEAGLVELYALWMHTNCLREQAMISGVEAFARRGSFKKGVLLVGAAHRQSLFLKSRLPPSDGRSSVTWDFEWELEEAALDADARSRSDTTDRGTLS